jgi:hypothetical protein
MFQSMAGGDLQQYASPSITGSFNSLHVLLTEHVSMEEILQGKREFLGVQYL